MNLKNVFSEQYLKNLANLSVFIKVITDQKIYIVFSFLYYGNILNMHTLLLRPVHIGQSLTASILLPKFWILLKHICFLKIQYFKKIYAYYVLYVWKIYKNMLLKQCFNLLYYCKFIKYANWGKENIFNVLEKYLLYKSISIFMWENIARFTRILHKHPNYRVIMIFLPGIFVLKGTPCKFYISKKNKSNFV